MPDFPTGLPDIPAADGAAPLATMHTSVSHSSGMNRAIANILALATKLGIGSSPPTANTVLRGTGSGTSAFGQIVSADISPTAGIPGSKLGTGVGRTATLTVAAVNASALVKQQADYVCDGVADNVEIQTALSALNPQGGRVVLSEGDFTLAGPITTSSNNSALEGQGPDVTYLAVVSGGGAAVNVPMIVLQNNRCVLRGLTVNGNKANNAGATAMHLVLASAAYPVLERVAITNSPGYGFVIGSASTYAVFEGCQALDNTQAGFTIQGSGVAIHHRLANCVTRGNNTSGFDIQAEGTNVATCTAYGNTVHGFLVSGLNSVLTGCSAISNSGAGFNLNAAHVEVSGCRSTGNGTFGYTTTTSGTMCSITGCSGRGNSIHGAYLQGAQTAIAGCQITESDNHGLVVQGGHGSVVSGNVVYANSGDGMYINASNVQVVGNSVESNAWHGIEINNAPYASVVGNYCYGNAAANVGYSGIWVGNGNDAFVAGNTIKRGVGGTQASYGLAVGGGSNHFLGVNDTFQGGTATTSPIADAGSNTRRLLKQQMSFQTTGWIINNSYPAGWTDITGDLSFRVNSPTSAIMIVVSGAMYVIPANANGQYAGRTLVDGAIVKKLGGDQQQNQGQASGAGLAGTVWYENLVTGTHVVSVQIYGSVPSFYQINGASEHNHFWVEVWEFER